MKSPHLRRHEGEKGKKAQIEKLQKDIKKLKDDIPFKVPFFETKVPIIQAPLVWTILMFGLICYLAHTRSAMFTLYARAVRLYPSESDSEIKEDLADIVGAAPWWLAPFPHLQGPSIKAYEIHDALGFSLTHPRAYLKTIIGFLLLGIIQLRVAWSGIIVVERLYTDEEVPIWLKSSIVFILLLITAISIVMICQWFRPWQEPDYSREWKLANLGRRKVLFAAVVVTLSAVYPVREILKSVRQQAQGRQAAIQQTTYLRKPRFRLGSAANYIAQNVLPYTFYQNLKSNIIHYVSHDKIIPGVNWINEVRLRQVPSTDLALERLRPRVHLSRASESFEQAAIVSLANKDYDNACSLLLYGIKHDLLYKRATGQNPSSRLYDLLAGITIRFKKSEYLKKMVNLFMAVPQSAHQRQLLSDRISKWNDSNSSWHRRWSDSEKKIKWQSTYAGKVHELVF